MSPNRPAAVRKKAKRPSSASPAAAKRRYEGVLEFVPVGFFVLSPSPTIREINLRGARLLESKPERLLGRNFLDFVEPGSRQACLDVFHQALASESRQRLELNLICARRDVLNVSLECASRLSGGRRELLVSLTDLSDQVTSERHAARLIAAVEQAADSIVIIRPEGPILYVNHAFETINAVPKEEALGRSYFALLSPRTEGAEWIRSAVSAVTRGRSWTGRVWRRSHGEAIRVLEIMISPIRDAEKKVFSYLVIEHDVTRESELEEHVRLIQKSEALGALAAGIAHDLNNVLGPIIINTELAKLSGPADGDEQELLDGVLKAAYRARDLVLQILAFSAPRRAVKSVVRLSEIVRDAAALLRAGLPSSIAIDDRTAPCEGLIEADPSQIHQVLVNLVNNAAQAMKDKGGTLTLDLDRVEIGLQAEAGLAALKPGPYIRLSITDTGTGIDGDILGRIFDPFFTTKAKEKGMGLGLAVVQGIVLGHGGTVTVETEPGVGTTFRIYLPEAVGKSLPGIAPSAPLPRGTERILLVDDEAILLQSTHAALEKLGYIVTSTTSPNRALQLLEADPAAFDLLFTDQTMPEKSGIRLALEAVALRPGLPVLLCSGYSDTVDSGDAAAAGVRLFLKKPMGVQDLARAVRSVLG